MTDIKFCGMTQPGDVEYAATLGVRYVGCVFAGGPRHQTLTEATALFASLPTPPPTRVGVFASIEPPVLAPAATAIALEVLQLHGDPTGESVDKARRTLGLSVWAVVRCPLGEGLPDRATDLWLTADGVVLDSQASGQLGGTGVVLDWSHLAESVGLMRSRSKRTRLIVAGGLTPDNVGRAIAALNPDVVDVSSGIEFAPGRKDHSRMRAFVEAVSAADRRIQPLSHPTSSR